MTSPPSYADLANMLGGRVRHAASNARAETDQQRAIVLRCADIAAKLTAPPLSYDRPDQWTGYIPPQRMLAPHSDTWITNDSPQRAALLVIYEEAVRRAAE